MRILLVVHGFPPEASGGAEIYAQSVARELARGPDDEVVVLAREARPERPEFSLRDETCGPLRLIRVNHTYREVRSFRDSYRDERLSALLSGLIDAIEPDVAHLHHLTNLSTDLVELLASRQVPIVFTLHDYWLLCQRGQLLDLALARCAGPSPAGCARCLGLAARGGRLLPTARRLLQRAGERLPEPLARPLERAAAGSVRALGGLSLGAARGADQIESRLAHVRGLLGHVALFLAPSRTLRDRFQDFGIPEHRIALHPYGHAHAPFAALRREASERLRIGFIGSLMVSKAPHLLLEAFAGLPPGRATLHLYGQISAYHGNDGYRRVLEPLLASPGVHFAGPVDHAEIPRVLGELDVVVVPSVWIENAPLTISEACLAGIPVVCSDLGGMAEMVEHERSGLRFHPGDAADLRRQLLRLLEEPGLLERLRLGIPPVREIEDDVRALRAHFARLVGARSAASTPAPAVRIAAVVVHHETAEQTSRCVRSLLASRHAIDRLVVVDNGSQDGSAEAIGREIPAASVVRSERNLGFAGGANLGIERALAGGAELVLILNSDARVEAHCIERLEAAMRGDPALGIVGPTILSDAEPAQILSLGLSLSSRSGRFREHRSSSGPRQPAAGGGVDALSGCAMLIRRELFERVGLFDEAYFFGFEDVELCQRACGAGFRCELVAKAVVRHEGHGTVGRSSPARLYYAARNHLRLARTLRAAGRIHATLRQAAVVCFNLAHALKGNEIARLPGLRAVLLGCLDHTRRRYGPAPGSRKRGARAAIQRPAWCRQHASAKRAQRAEGERSAVGTQARSARSEPKASGVKSGRIAAEIGGARRRG
jgi:GT2 family glycosyltransferase/glycosyltransferase involved in cell wall biosynthesis